MNDTQATQKQVSDTLVDIAHGITPLLITTLGIIACMVWAELKEDKDD